MTKSVEDIIEAIDQLDELSNKTLKNYLKHTSETPPKDKYGDLMSGGAAYRAGKTSGDIENPDNLDRKNRNRIRDNQERGRDQASDRIKARETGSTHLDVPHAYSKQGQKYHAELAALKRKHGIDENVIDIIEAIDQLDELSKETLTSYIDKAKDARQKHVGTSVAADLSDGIKKATKKLSNKKLTKESVEAMASVVLEDYSLEELQDFMMSEDFDQLDEISKKTLGNYLRRNADSRSSIAKDKGDIASTRQKLSDADWSPHIDDEDRAAINKARNKLLTKGEKLDKKDLKRQIGHHRAISKLTKESIESLVSAVLDGDQESASAVFNQAMSEKISSRMDSIKQEIASGL